MSEIIRIEEVENPKIGMSITDVYAKRLRMDEQENKRLADYYDRMTIKKPVLSFIQSRLSEKELINFAEKLLP
jgi:hypothetical protein